MKYLKHVFTFLGILCSFDIPGSLIQTCTLFHFTHRILWLLLGVSSSRGTTTHALYLQAMDPLLHSTLRPTCCGYIPLGFLSPAMTWSSSHPDLPPAAALSSASWRGVTSPLRSDPQTQCRVHLLKNYLTPPSLSAHYVSYFCNLRWSVKQESSFNWYLPTFSWDCRVIKWACVAYQSEICHQWSSSLENKN